MLNTKLRNLTQKVLAAVTLAPLMLILTPIVAIVNNLSGVNTFFVQKRYGQNGKKFNAWKFQSMRDGDAPDELRVTKLGRFMRKSSLDELPQLVNILKGEMDLVGWRPLMQRYSDIQNKHEKLTIHADQTEFASVREAIELIAQTKPGLLGVIQISSLRGQYESANETVFTEILQREKQYIQTRQRGMLKAAWQDAKIIGMAPYSVFKHQGHACRQSIDGLDKDVSEPDIEPMIEPTLCP